MNLARPSSAVINHAFRFWLALRKFLPKQKCQTFGTSGAEVGSKIEKIYVINLDREPGRWSKMKEELSLILDSSKSEILGMTKRYAAVDAKSFFQEPRKDADIDPLYTLEDQLFVEPQPLAFPTRLELKTPIRMSRAEIAVAQSHINVWRQVAASNNQFSLILEDDAWFHSDFGRSLDKAWNEIIADFNTKGTFDVLYVSYVEVKNGAPKTFLSNNVFRPERGLWHLSGYILSREGARKLLSLLPCRGPVDLWINHHFTTLDVSATRRSLISQRRDTTSTNSYSILPSLTTIGAINSEGAALFSIRPTEQPVFVFGAEGSSLSSLAMALSMLGYRCCSDLRTLPTPELEGLLAGQDDRVFDAYVNIGSLEEYAAQLQSCYPKAKFIFTVDNSAETDEKFCSIKSKLSDANIAVFHSDHPNGWEVVCEHLRCAPPTCSFPTLKDLGQRPVLDGSTGANKCGQCKNLRHDHSPWIVESHRSWKGIRSALPEHDQSATGQRDRFTDRLQHLDTRRWLLRNDTFTDNLALFRPSNVDFIPKVGAALSVRKESVGVREYTAASISSQNQYLFGRFEAIIQASNVPGVITGFFLHRNSPRQEIDIEIAGNRPDRLLVNVFYNPGSEGANFDYGYRGSPSYIDLGFDASESSHNFAIEWDPCEIRWFVDGRLVHSRSIWNPTPIPHLPMTLHLNSWICRSTQLAGRISNRTTIIKSITVEANLVISTTGLDDSSTSVHSMKE